MEEGGGAIRRSARLRDKEKYHRKSKKYSQFREGEETTDSSSSSSSPPSEEKEKAPVVVLKITAPRKRTNSGSISPRLSKSPKSPHTGLSPSLRAMNMRAASPPLLALDQEAEEGDKRGGEICASSCNMSSSSIVIKGVGTVNKRRITFGEMRESEMFQQWKKEVDRELTSVVGSPSSDLRDAGWRDMFDQGTSPRNAIKVATK